MDSKFFVPIATMLGGLVVFVAFAVWYELAGAQLSLSPWLVAGVCLISGGLVVFSGFS
jgi:hypothetical protein